MALLQRSKLFITVHNYDDPSLGLLKSQEDSGLLKDTLCNLYKQKVETPWKYWIPTSQLSLDLISLAALIKHKLLPSPGTGETVDYE